MEDLEDLIDVREACRMLGRSRWALIDWRHAGFGPRGRKLGWGLFYSRREVQAFIDAGGLEEARRGGPAKAIRAAAAARAAQAAA